MDTGLLALRVFVGLLLVGHGAQKLFGWFGGGGLSATAWFFRSVGYRPPRLMAGFIGGVELVGGAALAVGVVTPVAAAAVIATMLNAAVAVHKRNGLLAIDGGYEYPLAMTTAATTLGFAGAGAASLDATLGLVDGGVESGLFAVVLGLLAGSGVLLTRVAARSQNGPAAGWSAKKSPPDVVRSHVVVRRPCGAVVPAEADARQRIAPTCSSGPRFTRTADQCGQRDAAMSESRPAGVASSPRTRLT